MFFSPRPTLLRPLLLGLGLLLASSAARAQATPRGYDFLTLTALESNVKRFSKLLYSPALGSRTETQLEALSSLSNATNLEDARRNAELINQALSELTVAGWELVEVHTVPLGTATPVATTRYLFRKAKP